MNFVLEKANSYQSRDNLNGTVMGELIASFEQGKMTYLPKLEAFVFEQNANTEDGETLKSLHVIKFFPNRYVQLDAMIPTAQLGKVRKLVVEMGLPLDVSK